MFLTMKKVNKKDTICSKNEATKLPKDLSQKVVWSKSLKSSIIPIIEFREWLS